MKRWSENYTGPFPKLIDSRMQIKDLDENWFPVFHTNAESIGLLGAKNAEDIARFYLSMNAVMNDWVMYSQPDFWGHDHPPKSKASIAKKHLEGLEKALRLGEELYKNLGKIKTK